MNIEEIQSQAVLFSRDQILCLMEISSAKNLFYTDLKPNKASASTAIVKQLMEKGVISNTPDGLVVTKTFMDILHALFFPTSALLAIRNMPGMGMQVLIFSYGEGQFVLHTFPEAAMHRLQPMDDRKQIVDMLLKWFPLDIYPVISDVLFQTPIKIFEQAKQLAEQGQLIQAAEVLKSSPVHPSKKIALVRAIAEPALSGSMATFNFDRDTVIDAFSVAVLAGKDTAWILQQPDAADTDTNAMVIKSTGPDFIETLWALVQKL